MSLYQRTAGTGRNPLLASIIPAISAMTARFVAPGFVTGACAASLLILVGAQVIGAQPAGAASFDCKKATLPLDKRICGDAELSQLDEQLAADYAKAKIGLSPEGQKYLQSGQRDWLAFSRRVCKTRLDSKIAKATEDSPEDCLKAEYRERIEDLAAASTQINSFIFSQVDLYALTEDKPVADAEMGPGGRPGFSYRRISLPRIDQAPAGVNVAAWNKVIAIAAQKLAASDDDDKGQAAEKAAMQAPDDIAKLSMGSAPPADVDVGFNIGLVTPEMISVELTYGVMGHGAAHPGGGSEIHNVMLADGRELGAKDLFRSDLDWQGFMVKRSHDDWLKIMEDAPDQVDDKAIADVVKNPQLWQLTDKGLSLLFPFYSVGPYVVGEQQVDFTWDELKPYLVAKLPFTRPANPS